jgi:PLP dependent protein
MGTGQTIKDRLMGILEEIDVVASQAGRASAEIKLVIVTKTFGVEQTIEVLEAGATDLGENYVEEAAAKIQALNKSYPVSWHMIGHLQSRKTRQACELFDVIHSIDREKVARRLSDAAQTSGRRIPVLLECNVSGEESKFGWSAWEPARWQVLADDVQPLTTMPGIQIQGLMTMAPYFDDPELARPFFERLRLLRDFLSDKYPDTCWHALSMGMSQDFRQAILEGATILRIGTAIMGRRT